MDHRITWVHGIGRHTRGYSDPWRTEFDKFLHFAPEDYLEVLWDPVFHPEDARELAPDDRHGRRRRRPHPPGGAGRPRGAGRAPGRPRRA
jgi:hypothetical protein